MSLLLFNTFTNDLGAGIEINRRHTTEELQILWKIELEFKLIFINCKRGRDAADEI